MSKVSFSDYIIISNAIVESQVDEGAIWDAIKTKLGGAASDDQLRAKRDDLKGKEASVTKAISKTRLSKSAQEAELRKAEREKKDAQWSKTRTAFAKAPVTSRNDRAGQARGQEHAFAMGESKLAEGQAEFLVTYTSKAGGARGKGRIKGRDARDVRRKFGDLYFGKRLLSVEPVKAEPAKIESEE